MRTQGQRAKAVMLSVGTGCDHAAVKSALGHPSRWPLGRWCADRPDEGYAKEERERRERLPDEEEAAAVARRFGPGRRPSSAVGEPGRPSRPLPAQWVDGLAPGMRKRAEPRKRRGDSGRAGAAAAARAGGGAAAAAAREAGAGKAASYNRRRKLLGAERRRRRAAWGAVNRPATRAGRGG